MYQTIDNFLDEIKSINKESFTKTEILNLITKSNKKIPTVESNGVVVDTETYVVTINDVKHNLPKKVFNLLHYLISNKNKALTRDQLLTQIWGTEILVGGRTVDVHIRKLREFLPVNYIKTTVGFGYTWVEK
jgi:two-component system alkaline phosphatase synthesis response regulator PhoP